MTIHIGKRFVLGVVVVLLIAAAAAIGYTVGANSKDVTGAVKAAEARAKEAEEEAFERGRAQGDSEGRGAIVDEENSQEGVDRDVIEYLGYERTDWKDGRWYIVGIAIRGGLGDPKFPSVFERQPMAPGLAYSLCGDDNSSICYVEQ